MKRSQFASALNLIDDSVALVRRADALTWLIYLGGVAPFFALCLFEVTDLFESPYAAEQLLATSLGLTILYFWFSICQSVFSSRLYAIHTESKAALGRQFAASITAQAVLAGTKIVVWPLGFLLLVPHPSVTMFYQYACIPALERGGISGWQATIEEAQKDVRTARAQAVWLLALILLLRAVLWVNLVGLLFTLPFLWKIFTGLESDITRWPPLLMNLSTQTALCVLAYIGLDPVIKAACVLRRFARESETSGHDLRLRLRVLQSTAFLAILLFAACPFSRAETTSAGSIQKTATPTVTPEQMSRALRSVFQDPAESWNLPVLEPKKKATSPVFAFIDGLSDRIGKSWTAFKAWYRKLFEGRNEAAQPLRNRRSVTSPEVWLILSLFLGLLALAVLFAWWRRGRPRQDAPAAAAAALSTPVDLASEDVQADQKLEDEWMALAQHHRAQGNFRLTLRALYLSSLAALAKAHLISIRRGKSNGDYFTEFERRARRLDPASVVAFRTNLSLFEQSWYGTHAVTDQALDLFEQNLVYLRKNGERKE